MTAMSLDSSHARMRKTRSAPSLQSRLRAGTFGLAVILGLTVFAFLWFGDIGDRGSLDRALLPRAEGGSWLNPFDLNARKLLLFAILTCSVLVIWRFERGREDRHELFVLVGVLVMILGALNGSQGAEDMRSPMIGPMGLRTLGLDKCLALVAVGAVLVLAGLVRIALHQPRRGAIIGVCGLFTLLWMSWVLHRRVMTPSWAQPMNAPGYVVQNLAQVPTSDPLYSWTLNAGPDVVEIVERHGRALPIADRVELYEAALANHVRDMREEANRSNDRRFRHRGLELYIRADASLSAKQVIGVLDRCAKAGADRFELVARKSEPWVTGRLEIYARDPEIRSTLEVRTKADGTFSYLLNGREATDVEALLPRIRHAMVRFPDREKLVVSVEPGMSWQDVMATLEEVDWFSRQLSLGLLEEE